MYRWNLNVGEGPDAAHGEPDEYKVVTGYICVNSSTYLGKLKVTRLGFKRLLYPFDGAPVIGPFTSGYEARAAAEEMGKRIVQDDIARPEV